MLLLLAACSVPNSTPPDASFGCDPGEIRLESNNAAYPTLLDAIADARSDDAVCIGAGTFSLGGGLCDGTAGATNVGRLAITGAGVDETRLEGNADTPAGSCHLAFDAEALTLAGVTLANAGVHFYADAVTITDVRVTGAVSESDRVLQVRSDALTVDDLVLDANRLDYGAGFAFFGAGVVRGFSIVGNTFAEGYLGYFDGDFTWEGGEVRDNLRLGDAQDAYDLLESYGSLVASDLILSGNATNGPLLSAIGGFDGTGLTFADNAGTNRAMLTVYSYADTSSWLHLADTAFADNAAVDGAIGVYAGAALQLDGVDFAGNAPCDVTGPDGCLTALGEDVRLVCDGVGCEGR